MQLGGESRDEIGTTDSIRGISQTERLNAQAGNSASVANAGASESTSEI